jgi:hypothetical protein
MAWSDAITLHLMSEDVYYAKSWKITELYIKGICIDCNKGMTWTPKEILVGLFPIYDKT